MNRLQNLSIIAIIVFLGSILQIKATQRPDFNYPKSVISNAKLELSDALKEKNSERTIDALIKMSLAKSMISNDSINEIISDIDVTIGQTNNPCSKSLLYFLEAKILFSYYDNIKYQINSRDNHNASAGTDISEWDKTQFTTKISQLLQQALQNQKALQETPITKYASIIKINNNATGCYPTLFDFIAYKCIDLYFNLNNSRINGNSTAKSAEIKDIYTRLSTFHQHDTEAYINAKLDEIITFNEKEKLDSLYLVYQDSPFCAPILVEKVANSKGTESENYNNYSLLKNYLSEFKTSQYANLIANQLSALTSKYVSVRYPSVFSSKDSIEIRCDIINVKEFTLNIYSTHDNKEIADMKNCSKTIFGKNDDISPVYTKNIIVANDVPFTNIMTVKLPPLPYGRYIALPNFKEGNTKSLRQAVERRRISTFLVSDIDFFSIKGNQKQSPKFIAVNAITGHPTQGVSFYLNKKSTKKLLGKTDKEGAINISEQGSNDYSYSLGKDFFGSTSLYTYHKSINKNTNIRTSVSIFTDLSIYKPGDTIKYSAIIYDREPAKMGCVPNCNCTATFTDSNNDTIATAKLKTDSFGRVNGSFVIPHNRMNGTFYIHITDDSDNGRFASTKGISVSEYKKPTFFIKWTDAPNVHNLDSIITIKGTAISFTNMPKSNQKVNIEVSRLMWLSNPQTVVSTETETDSCGGFSFNLDPKSLKSDKAAYYTYQVSATTTDKAGETQSATTSFSLGIAKRLRWGSQNTFEANLPITLPLQLQNFSNSSNNHDNECKYVMQDKTNNIVSEGTFNLSNPVVDFSNIASGEYRLNFQLVNDTTVKLHDATIALYRKTDKCPPVESPLWIPVSAKESVPGIKDHILIGSSFQNTPVYYVINSGEKILKEGWITLSKGLYDFKYTMPRESNSDLVIQFFNVKDWKILAYSVMITPVVEKKDVTISMESFRDHISTNSQEKWRIHLSLNGKPMSNGAVICELFDKSINSIQNNTWDFSPRPLSTYTSKNLIPYILDRRYHTQALSWTAPSKKWENIIAPELELYNQYYFSNRRYASARNRSYSSDGTILNTNKIGTDDDFCCLEETAPLSKATSKHYTNITLRSNAIHTAFWLPDLITDEKGNATVEFTVPDVNTTWLLQVLGYNTDMATSTLIKEVVASKPIMTKPNLPRFLRQGDKTFLISNIENSTESTQFCNVRIELFNPANSQTLAKQDCCIEVYPKGTKAVSISYTVPDSLAMLGYRIYANNDTFRDGEQDIIPILQSTSAIIETRPFYLDAKTDVQTIPLKLTNKKGNRVTLEYCNNPIWYVATALPSIYNESPTTTTEVVQSLFAISVTNKMLTQFPQIGTALSYWKENRQDSALNSLLEKNSELKINTLIASPWLEEAKRQTLKMKRMCELTDTDLISSRTQDLINTLEKVQMEDGGWSWYYSTHCVSSEWTTLQILQTLGEIKQVEALPKDPQLNSTIERAIKYIDNKVVERLNSRKDKFNYQGFSQYAYVRSLFKDYPMSITMSGIYDKIISSLSSEWKSMDIADKTYIAITLANSNKIATAQKIIESIRQYGISTPSTGMFWDNLQKNARHSDGSISLTAHILDAFHKIDPQCTAIDDIRKWILLNKQTTDWNDKYSATNAIYSLLTTGSDWLNDTQSFEIKLNDKLIEFDKSDKFFGYCKKDITAELNEAHNILSINHKTGSPSWGAVYSQTTDKKTSIKANSVSELSISKKIVNISKNSSKINIGDKIQIQMIVKNTKDLEFVTIGDERTACFEPINKISDYQYADGLGFYMETKDSRTNLFIDYLPKGTHIFTYEVYATNEGTYHCGVTTIQCQYAPQIVAHSDGKLITIAQ